jgi:cyclic beta-1,2-glucan synthetase
MDFDDGIPIQFKTMVVVPAIVGNADEVDFLLDQLERHYLGNPDKCMGFALLTDFLDASHQHMPDDHILLDKLIEGVQVLNDRYSQQNHEPFFLFHRFRTWNSVEDCWMGWERKRGKLIQFNRLLKGAETSFDIQIGDLNFLPGTRYVITLDTDTILPRESACRLIATLAHPLNHAVFDRKANHFVAGYTMLQPRIEIHPASLNRSLFTRIFASETGLDLYTRAVSDVYQDLFGEGIYVGKGIYEVASVQSSSDRKIPENTIISHDLLEGLYGRVGLVTDVVFYEDFPPNYWSLICRWHRWVRGDWQLLPWLLHRVPNADSDSRSGPLATLGRWKILNNLLHSLQGPALFGLLIAGWLWLPIHVWVWTMTVAAISASEYFVGLIPQLSKSIAGGPDIGLLYILGNRLRRWLIALVFLPYESWVCLNAIASTLIRVFITHKHLLKWTTSAHILSQYGKDIKPRFYWQQMLSGQLFSLGLLGLMILYNPVGIPAIVLFVVVWFISPLIAWCISRPLVSPSISFSKDEQDFLHGLARRTWLC